MAEAVPVAAPQAASTTPANSTENAVKNVSAVVKELDGKTPESIKKRVIKADGQDIELDDAAFERYAQKGIGAEKRFFEANKLHKQALAKAAEVEEEKRQLSELKKQFEGDEESVIDRLIKQAQNDPQKLGKVRKRIEDWLIDQIKIEQATPEQQEIAKLQKQVELDKAEREAFKKQQEAAQLAAATQKYREVFSQKIMQGLEASGLPQTEWNVKHMADLQMQALKAGYDLEPQQLAEMLKSDRIEHVRLLTAEPSKGILEAYKAKDTQKILMYGKQLEQLAPKEFLDALRIYDLTNISSGQPNVPKKVVEAPLPKEDEGNSRGGYKMTWSEAEAERKRVVADLERQFRSR